MALATRELKGCPAMNDRVTVNPYRLLLEQADGEEIEAVVIGEAGMALAEILDFEMKAPVPQDKRGVLLSLEESQPFFDYEIWERDSYNVHPATAWTASWVISIGGGDAPILATRVPRNPKPGTPPQWRNDTANFR
jgi:hypothetical protein